jgi:hypothetical protein
MRQRLAAFQASRNTGFMATVSARALKVEYIFSDTGLDGALRPASWLVPPDANMSGQPGKEGAHYSLATRTPRLSRNFGNTRL